MGRDFDVSLKRIIGRISEAANQVPAKLHKMVKMLTRREYISYKGLRFTDRPKKRVALGEIAPN
jgi:hypothetical protein